MTEIVTTPPDMVKILEDQARLEDEDCCSHGISWEEPCPECDANLQEHRG